MGQSVKISAMMLKIICIFFLFYKVTALEFDGFKSFLVDLEEDINKGTNVSAEGGNAEPMNPCTDPKAHEDVWQEGCFVKTCNSGTVEQSLAEVCAKQIEKSVEKILTKKMTEKCF